jgi:hypothetical protein
MDDTSWLDDDEEWSLTLNDEPRDTEEEDEESEELNEADDNPEEQYRYSVSETSIPNLDLSKRDKFMSASNVTDWSDLHCEKEH